MKFSLTTMVLASALLAATAATGTLISTNYMISSGLLPAGSGVSSSLTYLMTATIGLAGNSAPAVSTNYQVQAGFTPRMVAKANTPPSIAGTPSPAATAGTLYSFTPLAADADGNPLIFSIVNQPAWASFNSSTGTLTGIPAVGTYSGIQISVNDGTAVTALPAFAITVASTGGGGGGGGATQVPVMDGWWLVPGVLASLGMLQRRRRA